VRLRAALLNAARELLLELGDQDKLSVRAVTARAGVTANALYLHFSGKDELLSAVMLGGYRELRAFLNGAIPSDAVPLDQLRVLGYASLEFADRRPWNLPRPLHDEGPRGRADARARWRTRARRRRRHVR